MPPDNVIPLKPTRPCPICGRPSAQAFFPFCSARCADIDLNRWLSGAYVIPGRSTDERDDDVADGPVSADPNRDEEES